MSTMVTIKCPYCRKEVNFTRFGNGYIAVCCDKIIYNSDTLPAHHEKDVTGDGDFAPGMNDSRNQ